MGKMISGGVCFLCGRNGSGDRLDRHHVFGGAYRRKSDKYGLVVPLCRDRCHIYGADAVHRNAQANRDLKRKIQLYAMEKYGWTVADFIREFGKNYL